MRGMTAGRSIEGTRRPTKDGAAYRAVDGGLKGVFLRWADLAEKGNANQGIWSLRCLFDCFSGAFWGFRNTEIDLGRAAKAGLKS